MGVAGCLPAGEVVVADEVSPVGGDDTDVEVVVDPNCPEGEAALRELDVAAAADAYGACAGEGATETPSSVLVGRAFSQLLRAPLWEPAVEALSWCDQSYTLDDAYDASGLVRAVLEGGGGEFNATVSVRSGPSQPEQEYAAFPDHSNVQTWFDGQQFGVEVFDLNNEWSSLTFRFFRGSGDDLRGVELSRGATYTSPEVEDSNATRFDPPCEAPFSRCAGNSVSTAVPNSTITVLEAGDSVGDTISIEFDLEFPGFCEDFPCEAIHSVTGTLTDVVHQDPEVAEYPFETAAREFCPEGTSCGALPLVTFLDYACDDLPSYGALHDQAVKFVPLFEEIAADLERAGEDPDIAFVMPHEVNPLSPVDVTLNQADVRALATLVRAGVALIELAAQYDSLGETEVASDQISTGFTLEYAGSCVVGDPYTGLTPEELVGVLNASLLKKRSGANFTNAQQAFERALDNAIATLQATPQGNGGVLAPNSGTHAFLDELQGDVEAVRQSLDGPAVAVPLVSEPIWKARLGSFFANPPDATTVATEVGGPLFARTGLCDGEVEGNADVGTWFEQGAQAFETGWSNGDGPLPSVLDGDRWDQEIPEEGLPSWLQPGVLNSLGVGVTPAQ